MAARRPANVRPGRGGKKSRALRAAGLLALGFGLIGAFAGLSGAATFVPYRFEAGHTLATAQLLVVLSTVGAAFSAAGAASGWRLLRGDARAIGAVMGAAAGCVATVAAFAFAMPPSTPSPVPGGPSVFVFLAVVTAAYAALCALVIIGSRGSGGPDFVTPSRGRA